jgi:hypothetical protein
VKTTLDIPDELFRQAKATAAMEGRSLKEFISEAVREKLNASQTAVERPWMKIAGWAAKDPEMRAELNRLEQIVEEEFEQIDEDDWK